jgi:hypothetical protein
MHIHNHHHIEPHSEVLARLNEISRKLDLILQKENALMVDYTKLTADITAQTTVLQGVVVGVQALNAANAAFTQQVADLKTALAANDPVAAQAAADLLDAGVQANTALVQNLIPAVTANTPTTPAVGAAAATAAAVPAAA